EPCLVTGWARGADVESGGFEHCVGSAREQPVCPESARRVLGAVALGRGVGNGHRQVVDVGPGGWPQAAGVFRRGPAGRLLRTLHEFDRAGQRWSTQTVCASIRCDGVLSRVVCCSRAWRDVVTARSMRVVAVTCGRDSEDGWRG